MKRCAILAVLLAASPLSAQELAIAAGFGPGAVLQREMPVPIWGRAKPGDTVTVAFAGQKQTAVVDASGGWRIVLAPLTASAQPAVLTATASSGEQASSSDVLVGEVWFCSGQSNMAMTVAETDTIAETKRLPPNPAIRQFRSKDPDGKRHYPITTPQTIGYGSWLSAAPETVANADWSAIPYYVAERLQRELGVPVGVINSSVGATAIQAWLPAQAFDFRDPADPDVKRLSALRDGKAVTDKTTGKLISPGGFDSQVALIAAGTIPLSKGITTSLYNGMVAPHAGTAIRGIMWYQGEANRGDGMRYHSYLHALIGTWRQAWGRPDLPFYFAQIAPYDYSAGKPTAGKRTNSAELWEAQTYTLTVPGTAMVTTLDVGDLANIHPPRKRPVAIRLADQALHRVYGRTALEPDPPVFRSFRVVGAAIEVTFRQTGSGLKAVDGKPLSWFTVAGPDGIFQPAEAVISGRDTVRVSAPGVPQPVHARYAWDDTARPNLTSASGQPAAAFRTDSANNLPVE